MLQGKKVLMGITGSIAAYKSILLVRELVKAGAEVQVILTPAARDFVTPLTLSTLSKNKVLIDLFEEDAWANHVMLGRWADVMIIAPLSCNTLAKMANGMCDNLLLAAYLSATCPVVVAPAMDEDMWKHAATKENLKKLSMFGNYIIPTEKGELASGLYGEGRMAEPSSIVAYIENLLATQPNKDLAGKKALVTAGPTHELIDPVRYIGNLSSGKMGLSIAKQLAKRGAKVDLILGPSSLQIATIENITIHRVVSAQDMYNVCMKEFVTADIGVMAAAVADYRPAEKSAVKIKKEGDDELVITLQKTPDILKSLGLQKRKDQVLVGFALETTNEKEYALTKLKSKNADMIVLNSLNDKGAGFEHDTNKVTIFEKNGNVISYELKTKDEVANDIVECIVKNMICEK